MRPVTFGLLLLATNLITHGAFAFCVKPTKQHAHLQWSEAASIRSPKGAWQVEVHPDLTSPNNLSPVVLRECSNGKSWPLFILQRDAEMYWGPNGKDLLVINQPTADWYQLLYYRTQSISSSRSKEFEKLDKIVWRVVHKKLGRRHGVFYLPIFRSWKDKQIFLTIGGTMTKGLYGRMYPYCYGIKIDSTNFHVDKVLSTQELKAKNIECEIFP